jgi:hypothetical protein
MLMRMSDGVVYTYDLVNNKAKIGYLTLEGKPRDVSAVVHELREGSRSPNPFARVDQFSMAKTISGDTDDTSGGDASHEVAAAETKTSEGTKKSTIKTPGLYAMVLLGCRLRTGDMGKKKLWFLIQN